MPRASDKAPAYPSTSKWLILAAFVWSQLAFAVHTHEHDHEHEPHEIAESCDICMQLDRDDDDASGIDVGHAQQTASRYSSDAVTHRTPAERFTLYRARASP